MSQVCSSTSHAVQNDYIAEIDGSFYDSKVSLTLLMMNNLHQKSTHESLKTVLLESKSEATLLYNEVFEGVEEQ